ncbi:NADH-ubiquinone oxidoreductase 15 kDa subunit [Trichostrongylus colubriformis]|uniref:NADH-ubiquinone oxidoreductase 15 kDa subunit n=1 Tax=Trichostrongylus colubriformis TaxID=6319 RepID=A0AAN8ESN3_TRICO
MSASGLIPENYEALTPILKTPISDIFALPLSQQGRVCGFFEAQFFRCMEAYGAKLGRKYCDLEHRDFRECLTSEKQKKRAEAIATQRRKLYWEGKLDKAFLDNHPEPGHFKPDYFEWNPIQ